MRYLGSLVYLSGIDRRKGGKLVRLLCIYIKWVTLQEDPLQVLGIGEMGQKRIGRQAEKRSRLVRDLLLDEER